MAPTTDTIPPLQSSQIDTSPRPDLSPAFLAQNRAPQVHAAVITITVLATIAVFLRFLCRWLVKARILWDDSLILLSLLLEWALSALLLYETADLKFGQHVEVLSPIQIMTFAKTLFATQLLYYCAQTTIKLSIIFLYNRAFGSNRTFRTTLYVTGFLVVSWFLASLLDTIFTCIPVQASWNKSISLSSHCQNLRESTLGTGISNLLLDIIMLALPVPMIWGLQVSKRVKVSLTLIFLLGGFVCATSIIRIHQILGTDWSATDLTWDAFGIEVWSTIESCTAIISSCLTTMKPLIIRAKKFTTRSTSGQSASRQKSGIVGSGSYPKPTYQSLDDSKIAPFEMTGVVPVDGDERLPVDAAPSRKQLLPRFPSPVFPPGRQ